MTDRALGAYRDVSIASADPSALIVQLFDGALKFLGRARRALTAGDQAAFAYAVSRAHAIVAELSNVLDRETGGDVARSLDALYDFLLRHLTEGLTLRSGAHVDRVMTILGTIRDGFDEARGR
jgi:flagellar protein FliS